MTKTIFSEREFDTVQEAVDAIDKDWEDDKPYDKIENFPEPVPVLEQCAICDFIWDYSEDIKDCPNCGTKIV